MKKMFGKSEDFRQFRALKISKINIEIVKLKDEQCIFSKLLLSAKKSSHFINKTFKFFQNLGDVRKNRIREMNIRSTKFIFEKEERIFVFFLFVFFIMTEQIAQTNLL